MFDLHSHILPGIDDGAANFDDSVEIVRELAEQGITQIMATPHFIDESIYASSAKENKHLLAELKRRLAEEKIDVEILLNNKEE